MECSQCKYPDSRVVETRQDNTDQTRRRRECMRCGHRFTTFEQPKDREPFYNPPRRGALWEKREPVKVKK